MTAKQIKLDSYKRDFNEKWYRDGKWNYTLATKIPNGYQEAKVGGKVNLCRVPWP